MSVLMPRPEQTPSASDFSESLEALTHVALRQARVWLKPLTPGQAYPQMIECLITTQAVLACAREQQLRFVTHMAGRRTRQEEREIRERRARSQARAAVPSDGDTARGPDVRSGRSVPPHPPVFWRESGKGPLLLLLNGWTASSLVWPTAWLRRIERHFRVVRIDTRGSGLSRTAPAPFRMADLADDAAAVIQAAGEQKATVLGVSMGGMIAQELALRHPDAVERLIVVASRPPAPAQLDASTDVLRHLLAPPQSGQALDVYFRELWTGFAAPGIADREPGLIDELVSQILERPTPRSGLVHQLWAVAGWHGSQRLGSLAAPTVVVHGTRDRLSPVGNGMRLARLIPNARYVELPGVGHLVPVEAGHALADIILETRLPA